MAIKMSDLEFAATLEIHGMLYFNMKNSPNEESEDDGAIEIKEYRLTEDEIRNLFANMGLSVVTVEGFMEEFEEIIPDTFALNCDSIGYYYS